MLVEMSKTKKMLAVLAILSTAIAVMADLVLTPVYGLIYQSYPEYMNYVNYFISGPMLVLVIASLLTAILMRKINKKTIMVVGGVIFAIGAIFGNLFLDNLFYLCAMRTLVGIGAGVTNVVAIALISDLYVDTNHRAKITGYYNAGLSIVGTLFSYFGGLIAESSGRWDSVFTLYWSAVPMVILLILFIPSIKPAKEDAAAVKSAVVKESLGWRFWWLCFSFFIFNVILGSTVLYYLSPYILENGIGGPEFTGIAASVKSIVGFFICLGFGFIYAKLKRQTISVMYIIAAVTMLLLVIYPSAVMVLVIGTVCAITYKIAMPFAYVHGSIIVPPSRTGDSASIVTAVYGIGSFISTYYATWLLGLMGTDVFTKTWIINVVVLAVMFVVEILVSMVEKKKTVSA